MALYRTLMFLYYKESDLRNMGLGLLLHLPLQYCRESKQMFISYLLTF